MNRKKIKKRKEKLVKSKEQRILEIEQIKIKLDQIGINPTFESYDQLCQRLDNFVQDGIADSFGVSITDLNRHVEIILSNKIPCSATICDR